MVDRRERAGRRLVVRLAAVMSLLIFGVAACEREQPAPPARPARAGPTPNIVFVLIDTLRADRLGAYGDTQGLTPTLDAIAAEGVLFERAIAPAPWTQPSIASLFSGVYPGVHGVVDYQWACDATNGVVPKVKVFADRFVTMAELLHDRGYATAAFVANPYVLGAYGFAQGFDSFDTNFASLDTPGSELNDAAIEWLHDYRDPRRPFFLYLHYMDVHGPYNARREYREPLVARVEAMPDRQKLTDADLVRLEYLWRRAPDENDVDRYARLSVYREYWAARYDAGVAEMDHHLADLRARLDGLGLWKDAYVIVASDHGEALFEHRHWDHGLSTHHPELHVPLILRWPGPLPPGYRVPATVRLLDVLPTLVDQLALPPVTAAQGASLMPLVVGTREASTRAAFAESVKKGPPQQALYLGPWKLIRMAGGAVAMLYDVAADPLEQDNVMADQPATAAALTALLERHVAENARLAGGKEAEAVPLGAEQLERLKSLGYVK